MTIYFWAYSNVSINYVRLSKGIYHLLPFSSECLHCVSHIIALVMVCAAFNTDTEAICSN